MKNNKIVPIVIAIALIFASGYFYFNRKKPETAFESLTVTYDSKSTSYTKNEIAEELKLDDLILSRVSITPTEVIFTSSEELTIDDKQTIEVAVKKGSKVDACMINKKCFSLELK